MSTISHLTSPGGPLGTPTRSYVPQCGVELPGVGRCEVTGEHERDGIGRMVHRHGPCSWNGGPYVEVDDHALNR